MDNTKALQFCSRFAISPNYLGYCGRESAPPRLKVCVTYGKCDLVEEEISKFIVLNPYLETISKFTGLDKFSYPVAESYWLGNEETNKAKMEDYSLLLDNFSKQGVPDWLITELKFKKPRRFIPTHLFQVLHVGVGRASGSVPYNLESINNCMIRWGVVKGVKLEANKVELKTHSLERDKGGYKLTMTNGVFSFDPEFMPGLKIGDTVAVHWGWAVKILESFEAEKLSFWTTEVLRSIRTE